MDEVVVATFPDHPGLQSKLGDTLRQEYTTSLQLSLARPYGDSRAVEFFLKHWMGDSLRRAWVSLENADVDITEDLVDRLFRNVVSSLWQSGGLLLHTHTTYGSFWWSATPRMDICPNSGSTSFSCEKEETKEANGRRND